MLALARAAGLGGMAGGQALDLAAERQAPDEAGIVRLQAMKTGALIRFGCEAGAIIAGSPQDDRRRLRAFGEKIGLAFQLADDILDLTSDAATMGKATGKGCGCPRDRENSLGAPRRGMGRDRAPPACRRRRGAAGSLRRPCIDPHRRGAVHRRPEELTD